MENEQRVSEPTPRVARRLVRLLTRLVTCGEHFLDTGRRVQYREVRSFRRRGRRYLALAFGASSPALVRFQELVRETFLYVRDEDTVETEEPTADEVRYWSQSAWRDALELLRDAAEEMRIAAAESARVRSAAAPTLTPERHFPTPAGAKWEDIEIRFLSEHRVEITVGGYRETRNYAEMGFFDRRGRGANKPKAAWVLLAALAKSQGVFAVPKFRNMLPKQRSQLEKRIQEIRRHLRGFFSIQDDPLPFKHTDAGYEYVSRFKLHTSASYET